RTLDRDPAPPPRSRPASPMVVSRALPRNSQPGPPGTWGRETAPWWRAPVRTRHHHKDRPQRFGVPSTTEISEAPLDRRWVRSRNVHLLQGLGHSSSSVGKLGQRLGAHRPNLRPTLRFGEPGFLCSAQFTVELGEVEEGPTLNLDELQDVRPFAVSLGRPHPPDHQKVIKSTIARSEFPRIRPFVRGGILRHIVNTGV